MTFSLADAQVSMFAFFKSSVLPIFSFGFLFFCVSCVTTDRTYQQSTSRFEEGSVVFSVQEYLTAAEQRQASAWAEYARAYSLLLEQPEAIEEATEYLRRALLLQPDSATIASALIGPRLLASDFGKIINDLQEVVDANPGATVPNMLYAECLSMLNRHEEAIAHTLQTIEHNNWQDEQLMRTAALMMSQTGNPKKTEKFLRRVFRHRRLRQDQIMLVIAADFWMNLAEAHEQQLRKEGKKANANISEQDTNADVPDEKVAAAPESDEPATKTLEKTKDAAPAEDDATKADTLTNDVADSSNIAELPQPDPHEVFQQYSRNYSPTRCRKLARNYLAKTLALPGIPVKSKHQPGFDGQKLLNDAFLRLGDDDLLAGWLAKLDGDEELRGTLPRQMLKLSLLAQSEQRDKLLEYLDSLHSIPFSPSRYQEEYILRQAIAEHYLQAESYEQAAKALEVIVTYYPRDLQARLRLAHLFLYLRRPQRGLALLAPLTKLPPHGWLLSAQLWRQNKKHQRALECLLQAEKVARELQQEDFFTTSFHTTYALVHESLGNKEQTIAQSRLAHALNPEDPSMCNFLGYILADHNQSLDEAKDLIEKALRAEPDNTAYLDSLAWVYYRQKNFPEALRVINESIHRGGIDDDSEGVIADHAGDIMAANGYLKAARYYWLLSISINQEEEEKISRKLHGEN